MFWNKKEGDSALPDLPPLKSPLNQGSNAHPQTEEDEEDESTEKHVLPSFPDSPIAKGFSQAAIKDAVSDDLDKENEGFKIVEMSDSAIPSPPEERIPSITESQPIKKQRAITQQISEPPESKSMPLLSEMEKVSSQSFKTSEPKKENIFVKIDKFYSAKKALETAKNQLDQIEELLKKIRETKLKEERELENWERDLMTAKARIREVNENIFEKVE
ncbi:MAG: hypothetical protein AABX07_03990 [Nanoarchaeota archaeon]